MLEISMHKVFATRGSGSLMDNCNYNINLTRNLKPYYLVGNQAFDGPRSLVRNTIWWQSSYTVGNYQGRSGRSRDATDNCMARYRIFVLTIVRISGIRPVIAGARRAGFDLFHSERSSGLLSRSKTTFMSQVREKLFSEAGLVYENRRNSLLPKNDENVVSSHERV